MIHLHNAGTHTFLQAYGTVEQIADRAKELGAPAVALTDKAGVSALYPFKKYCEKIGIKPILGAEINMVKSVDGDDKKKDKHTLLLLSKSAKGYSNLCKIITHGNLEGFYYMGTTDYKYLLSHKEGLVVIAPGELTGIIGRLVHEGKTGDALTMLNFYRNTFEDFYLEVTPNSDCGKLEQLAKLTSVPLVATCNTKFPRREDLKGFRILECIGKKMTMDRYMDIAANEEDAVRYQMTEEELQNELFRKGLKGIEEAIANTHKIADLTSPDIAKTDLLKYPGENKKELFEKLIYEGWDKRKIDNSEKKDEYKERLEKEMGLIEEKGYIDYFLIVWDCIKWAKDKGILVGPARGSAAGSLVCWLMEITEVDPLEWDLVFERFIDINREDPPDIDIDFEDTRRDEVKQYLVEKYGKEKVATIGTIMTFKGKVCIQDVGRIHQIPFKDLETLKELVIERSGGDSRASFTIEDTFKQFEQAARVAEMYPNIYDASLIESQARQKGIHAAGLLIGNKPLKNYMPLSFRNEQIVADVDKKTAEELGFLKLDLLGIQFLSVLARARELVKENHNKDIDYYSLPVDDPAVFEGFCQNKLFGVFQFEGEAVNLVCRQIQPRTFLEIADVSALSRPGPLHSGGTTKYIDSKNDPSKISYAHPIMKELAEETYGVIIYQEQVMFIMRNMGNMSWKDTAEIRRLISKSMGEEYFNTFKDKFMEGATQVNGVPEKVADEIWRSICTFGSWAFNKSHSLSYAYISYWCMWMKVHYPIEYYAALCEKTDKEERLNKIIKEFKKEGGTVLLPNVNKSKENFSIEDNGLRAGIGALKGIGAKTTEKIIANQPYKSIEDFKRRTKANKKTMDIMRRIGALNGLHQEQTSLFGSEWGDTYDHEPTTKDLMELFPFGLNLQLINTWKPVIEKKYGSLKNLKELEEIGKGSGGEVVQAIVLIKERNLRNTGELSFSRGQSVKDAADYLNLFIEDDSDYMHSTISKHYYEQLKNAVWDNTHSDAVFLIQGKFNKKSRKIFINNIVCLNSK